jgi:BclB C-terminal domain-containing protein
MQNGMLLGDTIDIPATSEGTYSYAVQMPHAGTITSFNVFFNAISIAPSPDVTMVVTAQMYQSTAPNTGFTPIAGTQLDLTPSLKAENVSGALLKGSLTGLNIPVAAQTNLLFVLYATGSGNINYHTVVGYVNAELGIS